MDTLYHRKLEDYKLKFGEIFPSEEYDIPPAKVIEFITLYINENKRAAEQTCVKSYKPHYKK